MDFRDRSRLQCHRIFDAKEHKHVGRHYFVWSVTKDWPKNLIYLYGGSFEFIVVDKNLLFRDRNCSSSPLNRLKTFFIIFIWNGHSRLFGVGVGRESGTNDICVFF